MELQNQFLFFFSALGAFNGLFLSVYFTFFIKNKSRATYFLAALLFVLSIRVTKSVFLTFYPDISSLFIQIGLTACALIGPFLYLYTATTLKTDGFNKKYWWVHIIPVVIVMIAFGMLYPYRTNWRLWQLSSEGVLGWILLLQWLFYTLAALYQVRFSLLKLFSKSDKSSSLDYWLVNIVLGCFLIWLAYNTTNYTSYIVGALSFSFLFYITLMIWFFRRKTNSLSFLSPTIKYGNKSIETKEALIIKNKLKALFKNEKSYLNPNLKLPEVANKIEIKSHTLSQYLNDTIGESFSNYVNKYRIKDAVEMLKYNNILTIEGIGNECGFKSNTSFYAAFKKEKGMTPAQYKKSLIEA